MHIHITATKEEVLESLLFPPDPPQSNDKLAMEAMMAARVINGIDDSIGIAGYNLTVEITDMK